MGYVGRLVRHVDKWLAIVRWPDVFSGVGEKVGEYIGMGAQNRFPDAEQLVPRWMSFRRDLGPQNDVSVIVIELRVTFVTWNFGYNGETIHRNRRCVNKQDIRARMRGRACRLEEVLETETGRERR